MNKTLLKAEALESATGLVPMGAGSTLAVATTIATSPMGTGYAYLLGLIVCMTVCGSGFLIMRAAYMPRVVQLRAAAEGAAVRR